MRELTPLKNADLSFIRGGWDFWDSLLDTFGAGPYSNRDMGNGESLRVSPYRDEALNAAFRHGRATGRAGV